MVTTSVKALLATETLNAMTAMAVMPSLPFYVMAMGANAFDIAMLGTLNNLAQMLFSPAIGLLSDRVGRKRILVLGLLGQACSNTMQAYSTSLGAMLAVRTLSGIVCSTGPVETAYLMEQTVGEAELKEVLILQRLVVTLGAIAGPLVAKFFSSFGWKILCFGMVASNLVGALIAQSLYTDLAQPPASPLSRPPSLGSRPPSLDGSPSVFSPSALLTSSRGPRWYRLFTGRETGILLLISFVFNTGVGISEGPEVVFFHDHFGYGQGELSNLLFATCVAALVFAPFLPPIMEAFGNIKICIAGCVGIALVSFFLVLGTGISWVPIVYAGLCVGLFGNLVGFGYMALVNQICPKDRLGTMLGLKGFVDSFAGTVSPAIGGALYTCDHFIPYGITCGFCVLAAGLFASMAPYSERAKKEAATDEEAEAMIPKEESGDMEYSPAFLTQPVILGKSYSFHVFNNELRVMLDDSLKQKFYAREGAGRNLQGLVLRRGATIGVDNFSQAVDESDTPVIDGRKCSSAGNMR